MLNYVLSLARKFIDNRDLCLRTWQDSHGWQRQYKLHRCHDPEHRESISNERSEQGINVDGAGKADATSSGLGFLVGILADGAMHQLPVRIVPPIKFSLLSHRQETGFSDFIE